MMIKKTVFRCFLVALCCVLVMGVSCPLAFAADYPASDYVVAFEVPVTGWEFEYRSSGDYSAYIAHVDLVDSVEVSTASEVQYSFGYISGRSGMFVVNDGCFDWPFRGFGDAGLLCACQPSDDGPLFFGYCEDNESESVLAISPDVYANLFSDKETSVTLSVSVYTPPVPPDNATASITDGVTGSIGFAGQVVNALISPDGALFGLLPVVGLAVGLALVVWGIKKFKSCTWGF